jgi:hypothetical protein
MVTAHVRPFALLELAVVVFQVLGVVTLCVSRLATTRSWATRGRSGFVVALLGLGVFGALCGRQDSEFALFAGATMTALLIGMTIGGGAAAATGAEPALGGVDSPLATAAA